MRGEEILLPSSTLTFGVTGRAAVLVKFCGPTLPRKLTAQESFVHALANEHAWARTVL